MTRTKQTHAGMFTSTTDDWATPQKLFDLLDAEFHFTLDPCASDTNHKCDRYFTADDDGLAKPWGEAVVFVNPPYGRSINKWVEKSRRESESGATVLLLIPARTDTAYWHEHVMRSREIRLIRGRIVFGDGPFRAPFPSAAIVFRPGISLTPPPPLLPAAAEIDG